MRSLGILVTSVLVPLTFSACAGVEDPATEPVSEGISSPIVAPRVPLLAPNRVSGVVVAQSSQGLHVQIAGTIATTSAPTPHLTYWGGPLIQSPKVYQVLWGAPGPGRTFLPEVVSGAAATLEKAYVEGPWLDWISSEYSTFLYQIGKPKFAASLALNLIRPESKNSTIYDSDVQAELGAQIAAGTLPSDSSAMFMVHFPAEVDVLQALTAYGRGVGTIPDDCGSGENQAGLCYPRCAQGYVGIGPVCLQTCAPGFHDDGLTCREDGSIIGADTSMCPWYDVCGLTFAQGCSHCPAGYHDDGCTCRIDPQIYWKSSYGRGVGSIPSCKHGLENDAGLCYPPCDDGFHGVGPLCWGHDRFCGGHDGFCGYHSSFLHNLTDVRYAVLADMGPSSACYNDCWTGEPLSDLTKTFSHELVEAITDPDLNTGWMDVGVGEIGDLCNSTILNLFTPAGTEFTVQEEWSDKANACR
jgi:hypothetical protein